MYDVDTLYVKGIALNDLWVKVASRGLNGKIYEKTGIYKN
jgi:hypothetical protein